MKNNLFFLIFLIILFNCAKKETRENNAYEADSAAIKAINEQDFAIHIKTLASDDFQGRRPFTEGETKTINYLKEQFQKLGLKPGNGDSYFQQVPMAEIESTPAGPMQIKGKSGSVNLNFLDEFVATSRHVTDQVKIENSELVFAGFGIVAPEYNWNDYEGLDVKGKTVIVMVNDPGFYDSTLFKGKTMTYYGRWTYKYEEAARQGAKGVLIIHDTAPASYPWSVVRGGFSGKKLYLEAKDNNMSRAAMEGWISTEAANKIFKLAGVQEDLINQAKKENFKPVPLGLNVSLTLNNSIKKSTSNNVLALIPGTDRNDEVIIYTAHWDHFGVGEKINNDSIYNGAVDNATGTAALIEIASAFMELKNKPSRSILFLAVTGEEEGLLGSEYYATNPVFPVSKTVANINIDALHPIGKTKDISVVGTGQSQMDEYIEEAAAKQGRTVTPDSNPSAGYFFRSDHFNLAKVGIPALYVETGTISNEHGAEWGKKQAENYTNEKYHSPEDEFDPQTWNLSGIVEDIQLLFAVGLRLSNESSFPEWKTGSEFKAKREKSLGE
ncbi:MAG TPA: M28 family metallopeptidase [Cytophagales bacterium]|nr:M28 family metallopeptidase [Cytophagales bacterium]